MASPVRPLCASAVLWIVFCSAVGACDKDTFRIAVDPGHTARNPGVISARGRPEWRFNQDLARLLASELKTKGFGSVFLTNEDGSDISLTERSDRANRLGAKLFVSIHHDSVQPRYLSHWKHQGRRLSYSDAFSGYSVFFSDRNGDPKGSLAFARLVGGEFRRSCLTPTLHHSEPIPGEGRNLVDKERGIYQFDDLVVLKSTKMPAVLVEAGLIVNRTEEILLQNPVYQKVLAASIARAVARFCEGVPGNDKVRELPGFDGNAGDSDYSCPPASPKDSPGGAAR